MIVVSYWREKIKLSFYVLIWISLPCLTIRIRCCRQGPIASFSGDLSAPLSFRRAWHEAFAVTEEGSHLDRSKLVKYTVESYVNDPKLLPEMPRHLHKTIYPTLNCQTCKWTKKIQNKRHEVSLAIVPAAHWIVISTDQSAPRTLHLHITWSRSSVITCKT